jgi:hypothetical protein
MLPLAEAEVRIEIQAMYSAVYLEKFALIETAGVFAIGMSLSHGHSKTRIHVENGAEIRPFSVQMHVQVALA